MPVRRRASAKKQTPTAAGERRVRRTYSNEILRGALRLILGEDESPSVDAAARVGAPSAARTLRRYAAEIIKNTDLLCNDIAETRATRLAFVDSMLVKNMGSPSFADCILFSKDNLEFFARVVKLYASLGFPLDRERRGYQERASARGSPWRPMPAP